MIIRIAPKQIVGIELSQARRNMKHLAAVNVNKSTTDCICYAGRYCIYCMKINAEDNSASYILYYDKSVEKYATNPNSILRKYCAALAGKNMQKTKYYK
jgi:hypothetical protein